MSKRMKQFSWSHPAFTVLEISLLLVLTLCILGQWPLLFVLFGITIFLSIIALNGSMLYQMSLNASSDDYQQPFSCNLYSLLGSDWAQSKQELQEEEFKPFVFKDQSGECGHK